MDYFQGVVFEYLRAKRSCFVNTEYLINLDQGDTFQKKRHWYCDALAVDFADRDIHLCEITYAKTLHAVTARLQAWCAHWPELIAAIRRDSAIGENWKIAPRVFLPSDLEPHLRSRISKLLRPSDHLPCMPEPIITTLEKVLPWKYRSWNGKDFTPEAACEVSFTEQRGS